MKRKSKKSRRDGSSLSKREFGDMMATLIHRAGEPTRPGYDDRTYSLVGANRKVYLLRNAYEEYRLASARERPELLKAWIRAWFRLDLRPPASYEDARTDLLPVIRRRGEHECNLLPSRSRRSRAVDRL